MVVHARQKNRGLSPALNQILYQRNIKHVIHRPAFGRVNPHATNCHRKAEGRTPSRFQIHNLGLRHTLQHAPLPVSHFHHAVRRARKRHLAAGIGSNSLSHL
ncbi:MAG: hypothetical protein EON60_02495 [Alphaproteobacteria bacterium]|nr:MAG: hypothetical protein EON60_02495 [Alphaproteobacteria bacterium]